VLQRARLKGVRLWLDHGQLRYKAPKGALTAQEVFELKEYRHHLVALLEAAGSTASIDSPITCRARPERAPLTFTQRAHWELYHLISQSSAAIVSVCLRLQGGLNLSVLSNSIAELVRRHDALRTRIVVCNDVPMQEVSPPGPWQLPVIDLTGESLPSDNAGLARTVEKFLLPSIDLRKDCLFNARLLRFSSEEAVLILEMEHLIADGVSRGILTRELITAYSQALNGWPISLPDVAVQLPQYAMWQRETHEAWLASHGKYWDSHLKGAKRLRIRASEVQAPQNRRGWGIAYFEMDSALTGALRDFARAAKTTVVTAALTAFVALVLRSSQSTDGVILYQTDSRFTEDLAHTVGYLASLLYLRVALQPQDSFADLLLTVKEEYFRAIEHADLSYLESLIPRPAFTCNPCFNWVTPMQPPDVDHTEEAPSGLIWSEVLSEEQVIDHLERDTEPIMGFVEVGATIAGRVFFPLNRFSFETMERFAQDFLTLIRALVETPTGRVAEVELTWFRSLSPLLVTGTEAQAPST
jgi:hypothetical protein